MNILLGNLVSFEKLGDKEKMSELESKLKDLGYKNEDNCEANRDSGKLTWHIYDIPRTINFSVLTDEVTALLKSYSSSFSGRVAVTADKIIN